MDYEPVVRSKELDRLYRGILALESMEDCYRFFEDLCTIKEITSMAQRLQVAALLRDGVTYQDIVAQTGASTATISRINRCITYGCDGYNRILDRIAEDEEGK